MEGNGEQTDGEEVSALTGRLYRGQRNCQVVALEAFLQQTTKMIEIRFD